jgi:hypothetical protein
MLLVTLRLVIFPCTEDAKCYVSREISGMAGAFYRQARLDEPEEPKQHGGLTKNRRDLEGCNWDIYGYIYILYICIYSWDIYI